MNGRPTTSLVIVRVAALLSREGRRWREGRDLERFRRDEAAEWARAKWNQSRMHRRVADCRAAAGKVGEADAELVFVAIERRRDTATGGSVLGGGGLAPAGGGGFSFCTVSSAVTRLAPRHAAKYSGSHPGSFGGARHLRTDRRRIDEQLAAGRAAHAGG